MRIDAVTVSVNCGDFLCHSLPANKTLFDRLVVVTSPDDAETHEVCRYFHVETVVSDAMLRGGPKINKGVAINLGLERLDFKAWCVSFDADIVLPPLTRHILERLHLSEQNLFGIDRVMCPSFAYWQRFLTDPQPQHENDWTHVGPFPPGHRLFKLEHGGYIPIGFFQMFHRDSNFLGDPPFYPAEHDTAAASDVQFALRWPRTHRHLLPEICGIHLATEDQTMAPMGINWEGRVTRRFEPGDPWFRRTRSQTK